MSSWLTRCIRYLTQAVVAGYPVRPAVPDSHRIVAAPVRHPAPRRAGQATPARGGHFTLAQVAASAGFSDQSRFSRHFKRLVGVTPGQYRTPSRECPRTPVRPSLWGWTRRRLAGQRTAAVHQRLPACRPDVRALTFGCVGYPNFKAMETGKKFDANFLAAHQATCRKAALWSQIMALQSALPRPRASSARGPRDLSGDGFELIHPASRNPRGTRLT